uniref:Uncharacterized protein n=1 Tax=Physcomitrium patens TaxID=3218 RepID=A0A2K1KLX1_PHYPA|nr:hypothetical protein PHYPA_005662 [Physcomitrium patens]
MIQNRLTTSRYTRSRTSHEIHPSVAIKEFHIFLVMQIYQESQNHVFLRVIKKKYVQMMLSLIRKLVSNAYL